MKRSEIFFSTLLVPIDFLALILAFLYSYNLRNQYVLLSPDKLFGLAGEFNYSSSTLTLSLDQYIRYIGLIIPGMIIIFALLGLYAMRSHFSWTERIARVIAAVSIGEGCILLLFLLKKDFFIPRSTVLYSWVLGIIFVLIGRLIIRGIQRYIRRYNIGIIRTAIIGKSSTAQKVLERLKNDKELYYRLVVHSESKEIEAILSDLSGHGLDELIVVNERYQNDDLIALRNYCLERSISFYFIPSLLTELPSTFAVRTAVGLPMIEVKPTPLDGWGRVMKRLFDIVITLLLIVIFSPLFICIIILITLTSPGPLIYKHKRIGKDKQDMYVWKFRSMDWKYCTGVGHSGDAAFSKLLTDNPELKAEWDRDHKLKDDPRISVIGKILRKTSLDELPQFFNILGGSLSLVGPRPIVVEEIDKYGERAHLLFTVKPGLTGLWQVSGRTDTSYAERIALDTYYIEHWNLFSDSSILIRTALMLITKSNGAY